VNLLLTSTPDYITAPIIEFCRELVGEGAPGFIDITPRSDAAVLDCFPVIEREVAQHGGEIVYGWRIWEWPGVMLEAEFHAVWRDPDGVLHDLTPTPQGERRSLFVPDPARIYDGRQINNVRKPLTDRPELREFMAAADAEFEVLNRGERATKHGEIRLGGAEAEEILRIRERKQRALAAILGVHLPLGAPTKRPGRNDACHCGSGKKYKKCHLNLDDGGPAR